MRTPQLFLALALAISVASPAAWSFPGFGQSQWFGNGGNRLSGYASNFNNNINNGGGNPLTGLISGNGYANNNSYGRRNGFLSRFMPANYSQQTNSTGGGCGGRNGNAGYGNSGYGNAGYGNSGYGNSGYGNSGYGNSGYGNSGYGNSGYGIAGIMNNGMGSGSSAIGQMFNGGYGQNGFGQNYNNNAYGQYGNEMGEFRHHHHHHHQNW